MSTFFTRRQTLGIGLGAVVLGTAAACGSPAQTGATATGGAASGAAPRGASSAPAVKDATLTIADNSIKGGKNAAAAEFLETYTIPKFVEAQKAKGVTAKVTAQPSGVDDEQYKSKQALDLKAKAGADVLNLDGIWVGEFAQAGYIKPLADVVGDAAVKGWEGWSQIPPAVQANASFDGKVYGVPAGTDGRVLYYNKKLFTAAGLPDTWQPTSWQDILDAGTKLKGSGVTPVQINAGTAMGEATTMQGILPLLVGAGTQIYDNGKWTGNTQKLRDVLSFYKALLDQGLMDKNFQLAAKGRDDSFAAFAAGKVGILLEGDYFWRSVINPNKGSAAMASRDSDVGYALIPAQKPGSGIKGQNHVSMSGGGGTFLNPNSKFPQQAWELMQFMASKETVTAGLAGAARITARQDVNADALKADPMLSFVSQKVLPLTAYRPGLAIYPQVSQALQQATADVVSGKSVDDAAKAYQAAVEKLAGGAANVASN